MRISVFTSELRPHWNNTVYMPKDAVLLCAVVYADKIVLQAMVDWDKQNVRRHFEVVKAGDDSPDDFTDTNTFISTVVYDNTIMHVFENTAA